MHSIGLCPYGQVGLVVAHYISSLPMLHPTQGEFPPQIPANTPFIGFH
jgi:hypothetical protein